VAQILEPEYFKQEICQVSHLDANYTYLKAYLLCLVKKLAGKGRSWHKICYLANPNTIVFIILFYL
jgi:hypothetical protein